jgi:predicted dehydrogenase
MADRAAQNGLKTMVPFTWRFMPNARYLKELVEGGYIGKLYHCDMRYYGNFARDGKYMWRLDGGIAGSGVLGDLGSHHIYIARWLFGKISRVNAHLRRLVPRPELDPDGNPYQQADDTTALQVEFENGASGFFHATSVSVEDAHVMEFSGSDGTLYSRFSFPSNEQRISGIKADDTAVTDLPIPDHIWDGADSSSAFATFSHHFFKRDWMTRGFITAIAEDKPIKPDFQDGAEVQRVLDAALKSHQERRWIDVDSIH